MPYSAVPPATAEHQTHTHRLLLMACAGRDPQHTLAATTRYIGSNTHLSARPLTPDTPLSEGAVIDVQSNGRSVMEFNTLHNTISFVELYKAGRPTLGQMITLIKHLLPDHLGITTKGGQPFLTPLVGVREKFIIVPHVTYHLSGALIRHVGQRAILAAKEKQAGYYSKALNKFKTLLSTIDIQAVPPGQFCRGCQSPLGLDRFHFYQHVEREDLTLYFLNGCWKATGATNPWPLLVMVAQGQRALFRIVPELTQGAAILARLY